MALEVQTHSVGYSWSVAVASTSVGLLAPPTFPVPDNSGSFHSLTICLMLHLAVDRGGSVHTVCRGLW